MGVVTNIKHDSFPQQGGHLGKRVLVMFHHDTDHVVQGVCVRDDAGEPGKTIIQLDDGCHVLVTERQHISIVENSISPERDRRNRQFIVCDVFGRVATRRRLLFPDATPEQRALYVKVSLRAIGVSALAALLFVGLIVLRSHS
ncbi:hypothetical protein KAM338_37840 [Aeromonas caviae]|jgi:hypothetical protein|uniref:Uncharacterized protein n=3 Tax=Aeromonas TaxID=642 RepID=A0A189PG79_AERSS|nr:MULTISPECIES: hypothetical protein [Aeromonas]ABO92452.1 hypothetical protein ASA_P4G153 [Aeromonas salmonicida subsp. salmonicida A449]ALL42182.1 hypothetical protein [Aeromonas salmonicida subsp. salmonicida]MDD1845421.1 hypothetical protein [Aeromonas veronii]OKA75486.1 hypothetical protein BHR40_19345 [Aeromonas salmonicida subsp. salmonicida]BDA15768.1 hypothetical protein KAM339_043090 [Aeromonas caviae]